MISYASLSVCFLKQWIYKSSLNDLQKLLKVICKVTIQ